MDYLAEHRRLLKLEAERGSIDRTDDSGHVPATAIKELVDAGLVTAIDAKSFEGPSYINIAITTPGREYLRELENRHYRESWRGRVMVLLTWFANRLFSR